MRTGYIRIVAGLCVLLCATLSGGCQPGDWNSLHPNSLKPHRSTAFRGPHFPVSNEARIDSFADRINHIGGVYVGVGTDQNLQLIGYARSSRVWLVDIDPVALHVNRMHLAFIAESADAGQFIELWSPAGHARAYAVLARHYGQFPHWTGLRNTFLRVHPAEGRTAGIVYTRLRNLLATARRYNLRMYLNDHDQYAHLRKLVLNQRIHLLEGDVRDGPFYNIARKLKSNSICQTNSIINPLPDCSREYPHNTIRVLYLSNVEDYLENTPAYRRALQSLPMDDDSLVLRTSIRAGELFDVPPGELRSNEIPFHYNAQS
ncbi:MAG: hypothetical protein KDK27_15035, partial [Leptospiraceae bacterium]|nr:hypothetical protein [Leptospiraceae bacterium]